MLSRTGMVEFLNVMSSVNIKDVVAIIILADLIRVARLFHRVGERGMAIPFRSGFRITAWEHFSVMINLALTFSRSNFLLRPRLQAPLVSRSICKRMLIAADYAQY